MRWGIWHWRAMVWLAVTLAIFLLVWQPPVLWQRMVLAAQDGIIQALVDETPVESVVLVDIDEASLEMMGPWPWSRALMAQLSRQLVEAYQVPVVGLDIVFPEPAQEQADMALAEVLRGLPVLPVVVWDMAGQAPPLQVGEAGQGVGFSPVHAWPQAQGVLGNHALLAQSAPLVGHISPVTDVAGQMRYLHPFVHWQGQLYPMLSLAILSRYWQQPLVPMVQNGRVWPFAGRSLSLSLDDAGRWQVPYRHEVSSFTVVPAWQVLLNQVPAEVLSGRLVIVGSSAMGLSDRVATPLAPVVPGMLVHAQALTQLLDNQSPPSDAGWALLAALLMLAGVGWMLSRRGLWMGMLVWLGMALGWLLWSLVWYAAWGLVADVLLPLLAGALVFALQAPLEWALVRRESQRIYRLFREYLPASVLTQLMRSGDASVLQPQQRVVTVLFADMEGFTTMAAELPTAQAAELTREVLGLLTQAVHEHEGTLDKYMGDALMAFWNAPVDQADHAVRAVACARRMQVLMAGFNARQASLGLPVMGVRIGINTGEVLVGDLGTELRHAYTVLGDAVNVAHRLQVLTRRHQVGVLLGEATAQAVAGAVFVDEVYLRGRQQAERVYTLG